MIPADKKIERMLNVAHMYYERDMTQNQIAKELGISRPLVSLLLTEARSCGLVTITINDVESREQLAAKQLESCFNLHRALVQPDAASADATDNATACAAFRLCFEDGAENIGIGWGSMMGRMADCAEPEAGEEHKNCRLFPLIGGIGASYRGYHTNELARIISGKLGCEADYLYFPAFFDSEQELALIRNMETFRGVSQRWDDIDLAFVNVSNYPSYPDLGVEYRYSGQLLRRRAVGRILAHYYDEDGSIIQPDVDNVIQCSVEQLSHAGKLVALCSAHLKEESVIGALRLKLIDTLVLPCSLAERVLARMEKSQA